MRLARTLVLTVAAALVSGAAGALACTCMPTGAVSPQLADVPGPPVRATAEGHRPEVIAERQPRRRLSADVFAHRSVAYLSSWLGRGRFGNRRARDRPDHAQPARACGNVRRRRPRARAPRDVDGEVDRARSADAVVPRHPRRHEHAALRRRRPSAVSASMTSPIRATRSGSHSCARKGSTARTRSGSRTPVDEPLGLHRDRALRALVVAGLRPEEDCDAPGLPTSASSTSPIRAGRAKSARGGRGSRSAFIQRRPRDLSGEPRPLGDHRRRRDARTCRTGTSER